MKKPQHVALRLHGFADAKQCRRLGGGLAALGDGAGEGGLLGDVALAPR